MEEIDVKKYSNINLYEVLNLNRDALKKKIKKNYNKLVLKYHPDKKNGDIDKFQAISIAYKILSNDELRKKYDSEYKDFINNQKSYADLKSEFNNQNNNEKTSNFDEKIKLNAAKEFDRINQFLNDKHGSYEFKTTTEQMIDNMEKLSLDRENLKIDKTLDKNISNQKFNEEFEKDLLVDKNQIIKYDVQEFNNVNQYNGINDFNIYSDIGISNDKFTSLDDAFQVSQKSKEYLDEADKFKDNYDDIIKKRLEEYNRNTELFNNRKITDFK